MKQIIGFALRKIPRKYLQLFSHIVLKVLSPFFYGKNVECTVCGKHFRKFLPYGRVEHRENALCPNCLSLERHRLMWLYLDQKTNFFTDKLKVLHVAPEICFIKRFEKIHGDNYITADIESPLAKVKMDVHNIPFEDNHFDVVFCNHVLEHVEDDVKVLKEFYRVLKPGGFAVLQSPIYGHLETTYEDKSITDPKEREKHFGQDDHCRIYGQDYGDRLRMGGFQVAEDTFAADMPEEKRKRYGLMKEEIMYFCTKS